MSSFVLKISSPEGDLFYGEVSCVSLRAAEGDIAVMAGHIPFISSVKPCDCKIEMPDGSEKLGHTEGGLITVSKEMTVLLAGDFVWKEN